jgi:hypothetical protein
MDCCSEKPILLQLDSIRPRMCQFIERSKLRAPAAFYPKHGSSDESLVRV